MVMILTLAISDVTIAADTDARDNGIAAVSQDDDNSSTADEENAASNPEKPEENTAQDTTKNSKENQPAENEEPVVVTSEPAEQVSPAFAETYEDNEIKVNAEAAEGILPQGTKLVVSPITDESKFDVLSEKMVAEAEARDKVITGFGLYDIGFELDGNKVEPNGDVKITASFKQPIESAGEENEPEVMVVHMPEDGTAEVVNADAQTNEKAVEKVEFVNDNFSPVAILTVEDKDTTSYSYETPVSEGSLKDLELKKTATETTKDGDKEQTFDIDLSVKGLSFTDTSPVDITFVVDLSNSMTNNGSKNLQYTKEAITSFIDAIGSDNNNIRYSVVAYGSEARAYNFNNNGGWTSEITARRKEFYTTSGDAVKNVVNSNSFKPGLDQDGGGTNTEAGFLAANKVTNTRKSTADSIVIFMTDGVPTFRYASDGTATSDGDGMSTSDAEFNEAVDAAKALKKAGNSIYTVGLLTNYGSYSAEMKCANKLLSDEYSYRRATSTDWRGNESVIYTENGASYSNKYFKVTNDDTNVGEKLSEIYEEIAKETLFLASGTVTDVLPEGFELVEAKGWTVGADGKTLTYSNVKAGPEAKKLPTIKVKYVGNGYGTEYTNANASYAGTLYDGTPFSKNFDKPVAGVHPKTTDDEATALIGENQIIDVRANDPFTKLTVEGYDVSDYEIIITDKDGNEYNYTDTGDKFTVSVNADNTVTFKSVNGTEKEFYYVVKAKVTSKGENFAIDGTTELVSRPTKVTVKLDSKPDFKFKKVNSEGKLLAEAEFTLYERNDDGSQGEEIAKATSDSEGVVEFKGLSLGTYILKETNAPKGYVALDTTWILKAEKNDEGVGTATLYMEDGVTPVELKDSQVQITNFTQEEWVKSKMDYDKTATVKNWEDRTYDININASSKITETSTETKGGKANVMLVLDKSGSMNENAAGTQSSWIRVGNFKDVKSKLVTTKVYGYSNSHDLLAYLNGEWKRYTSGRWQSITDNLVVYSKDSRLHGLKEAAGTFVSSMAESSPESKLGVATFNNNGSLLKGLSSVKDNEFSILQDIYAINATNSTAPGKGLKLAYTQFAQDTDNVPKYVILFTDGKPEPDDNKAPAEEQAKALKELGVTVYTIGFGLNDATKAWLEYNIATPGCAKTASDIDELKKIFEEIQQSITQNVAIANAEIKDVIDSRFVILDDNGTPITKDYPGIEKGVTLANGGTVYYDEDGVQFIKWADQTIPNKAEKIWGQTFTVKAKDDYIGGNNVTTNISPDSAIYTGYGDAVLPQPSVNVKADLTVDNTETTIFWGDKVPVKEEILNKLFTTNNINMDYDGVDENDFTLQWYLDEECTKPVTLKQMAQIEPNETANLYLKVSYDAGEPTDESTNATGGNIAGGSEHKVAAVNSQDSTKEYGVYKVNIVKGQLTITKTIDEQYTNINQINANQSFVFKIERKDTPNGEVTDVFYEVLSFDANGKLTSKSSTITGLKKGYYTVTEETDWSAKYTLNSVNNNYEAASNDKDNTRVKDLYIGKLLNSPVTLSGVETKLSGDSRPEFYGLEEGTYDALAKGYGATAKFTNNIKSDWKWLSDTASAVNSFVK